MLFYYLIKQSLQLRSDPQALALALEAAQAMANESMLTFSPLVKYPQDLAEQYKLDYPKLTEYLRNELPSLSMDNLITEALEEYGNLTQQQIEEALIWGDLSSITLRIVDMPCCWGAYGPQFGYGEDTILLSTELAQMLQEESTISEDALSFFIAITILHEVTHLGDYLYNGDMYIGEEGNDFELFVTGTYQLDPNNANQYIQGYKLKKQ